MCTYVYNISKPQIPAFSPRSQAMARRPRPPSIRNLRLYHELHCAGRTQVQVAARYCITQGRVSHICARVEAWIDRQLNGRRAARGSPGQRLHLAIAWERIHLQESCEPLWILSGEEHQELRYVRRRITLEDGKPVVSIEITTQPDRRHIDQALNVTLRLLALEKVAQLGPFADLPQRYFQQQASLHDDIRPASPNETSNNATEKPGRGVILAATIAASGLPSSPGEVATCDAAGPGMLPPSG
jgi:hypothetical protein